MDWKKSCLVASDLWCCCLNGQYRSLHQILRSLFKRPFLHCVLALGPGPILMVSICQPFFAQQYFFDIWCRFFHLANFQLLEKKNFNFSPLSHVSELKIIFGIMSTSSRRSSMVSPAACYWWGPGFQSRQGR